MPEKTQNRLDGEHDDHVDRILDAALVKYAAVEARIGLEERVLANLHAERAQAPSTAGWRWWQWAAVSVAAGIIVVILAWRSGMLSHPAIANHPSITAPGAQATTQLALNGNGKSAHVRTHPTPTADRPGHPNPAVAAAAPRLDIFPSPQPLSDQEKILANYVAQFHDQAVLIARARAEELQKDREEDAKETGSIHTDLEPATN